MSKAEDFRRRLEVFKQGVRAYPSCEFIAEEAIAALEAAEREAGERYIQSLEHGIELDKKTIDRMKEMKEHVNGIAGCFAALEAEHTELRRLAELSLKPDAHQAREALSIWLGENPE